MAGMLPERSFGRRVVLKVVTLYQVCTCAELIPGWLVRHLTLAGEQFSQYAVFSWGRFPCLRQKQPFSGVMF